MVLDFEGNENNFMTHDECEAMCDELIQDHRTRTTTLHGYNLVGYILHATSLCF
jgi:hypothetical protein